MVLYPVGGLAGTLSVPLVLKVLLEVSGDSKMQQKLSTTPALSYGPHWATYSAPLDL